MSAQLPDPVIIDYIRANRGRFGREAIDGELHAAGHSPEAIAAVWAALEAENNPSAPPDVPPSMPESTSVESGPDAPLAPDGAPQATTLDPAIGEYIRANRGSFSREEIERELLVSGHQQADIVSVWAAIEAEEPPVAPATPEADAAPFIPLPPIAPKPDTDPLIPMIPSPSSAMRDPAIDRYIRENRGIYTRPAIIDSLLASGHSRADIDAAWAAIAAAEAPPLPPEARADRRAVLNSWRFWLTAVLSFVALIVLPTVLTWAFPDQPIGPGVGCALLVGFVAIGLILLVVKRAREVAYGFLAGVGALFALFAILTLIGFILLIVVFGICLVVLGQQAASP
jgi:hypothetical protein